MRQNISASDIMELEKLVLDCIVAYYTFLLRGRMINGRLSLSVLCTNCYPDAAGRLREVPYDESLLLDRAVRLGNCNRMRWPSVRLAIW